MMIRNWVDKIISNWERKLFLNLNPAAAGFRLRLLNLNLNSRAHGGTEN